ncbi:hypothetical protein FRC01_008529, partial [Tulasnella sp. 417]
EWGDRSQIATIALAAAHNVYVVTLGTVVGHSVCTAVAVIGGRWLSTKISVKHVTLGGAVLFLLFAVIYFYEAWTYVPGEPEYPGMHGPASGTPTPNRKSVPLKAGHDISSSPTKAGFMQGPSALQPGGLAQPPINPAAQDVRMDTAKGAMEDVRMETARPTTSKRGPNLKLWERELVESQEIKRKATVAQLYFLDYYFQTLGFLAARKERKARFDADTRTRQLSPAEYAAELKSYNGRERVLLRKRRTKLRLEQFHILAQVGQGGYGEVYLARKSDTGEVCALKKMRKRTLHKMDEIRHVLVERDILTATKTPWLEVLRGKAYSYSVDYWSLGCILFEFLAGFPPFSGGTPEETWTNLKNWTKVLRRPEYEKEEDLIFNLSDVSWDAVTRLIAHHSVRFSSMQQVKSHPFFNGVLWDDLRATQAPFVPALDSDIDTGYYDDFTSAEDMAKYAEVKEKQKNVANVKEKEEAFGRGVWVGFTFGRGGGMGPSAKAMGIDDDGAFATIF